MTTQFPISSLDGKVVVITGAASGMGRAAALLCAARGAAVVAADLNAEGAKDVAAEIESAGGAALGQAADLTAEDDVTRLIDAAVSRFGTVHALHNNAYAVHPGAATDLVSTSLEAWDWTIRTCLTSQFLCARAVLPHMLRNGTGSIINVSSGNGFGGSTTAAAYGAAKAGVAILTKYIATQYGKRGIRCNTLVPGWTIATGWTGADEGKFTATQRGLFDAALEDVCMTDLARPEDIAPVVAFLASDDARYVQAATIDVNGGLLAHMPGAAGRPAAAPDAGGPGKTVMTSELPGVGVLYRATDQMRFLELARAAGERGFTSLVLGEHTHIPVSSDPSWFPGAGPDIPDSYPRLLDPYVALSFVAAQTSMKIGTCTSLPAMHDPIALAKALATLDFLAGGRLTLGVGYGWNRDEFTNHGRDYKDRRAIVREHVELMRQLWTQVEAEYHGEHANLERSWSWPKPAQPTIPVLLGAAGQPLAMRAIVEWADGWMPGGPVDWIAGRLGELRRRWDEAGRGEPGPVVWAIQEITDDSAFRADLARLAALGVAEVLISFDTVNKDEILPVLDRYAKVIAEF